MEITIWSEQERALFTFIREGLSGTWEEGRNAFIGEVPPIVPAWFLFMGGGSDARNTWNIPIRELHMDVDLGGRFYDRGEAQAFALQILNLLPITGDHVEGFQLCRLRSGGMPTVIAQEVQLANEDAPRVLHLLSIGLEAVFNVFT